MSRLQRYAVYVDGPLSGKGDRTLERGASARGRTATAAAYISDTDNARRNANSTQTSDMRTKIRGKMWKGKKKMGEGGGAAEHMPAQRGPLCEKEKCAQGPGRFVFVIRTPRGSGKLEKCWAGEMDQIFARRPLVTESR